MRKTRPLQANVPIWCEIEEMEAKLDQALEAFKLEEQIREEVVMQDEQGGAKAYC